MNEEKILSNELRETRMWSKKYNIVFIFIFFILKL